MLCRRPLCNNRTFSLSVPHHLILSLPLIIFFPLILPANSRHLPGEGEWGVGVGGGFICETNFPISVPRDVDQMDAAENNTTGWWRRRWLSSYWQSMKERNNNHLECNGNMSVRLCKDKHRYDKVRVVAFLFICVTILIGLRTIKLNWTRKLHNNCKCTDICTYLRACIGMYISVHQMLNVTKYHRS